MCGRKERKKETTERPNERTNEQIKNGFYYYWCSSLCTYMTWHMTIDLAVESSSANYWRIFLRSIQFIEFGSMTNTFLVSRCQLIHSIECPEWVLIAKLAQRMNLATSSRCLAGELDQTWSMSSVDSMMNYTAVITGWEAEQQKNGKISIWEWTARIVQQCISLP